MDGVLDHVVFNKDFGIVGTDIDKIADLRGGALNSVRHFDVDRHVVSLWSRSSPRVRWRECAGPRAGSDGWLPGVDRDIQLVRTDEHAGTFAVAVPL